MTTAFYWNSILFAIVLVISYIVGLVLGDFARGGSWATILLVLLLALALTPIEFYFLIEIGKNIWAATL